MRLSLFWILGLAAAPSSVFAHHDVHVDRVSGSAESSPLPAGPLGEGAWRFDVVPGWAKTPPGVSLGPTHGGVGVDGAGNIYVSSSGPSGILVFDRNGAFLRSLAPQLRGIHGFTLRDEGGSEFIYAVHVAGNQFAKIRLDGHVEWTEGPPFASGLYPEKKAFKPTAIAVGPDGRIYVADGYGASVIHVYSPTREYLKTIGTKGTGDGQFDACHGLSLDLRYEQPLLLVCDRENRRLVHLDLEGRFVRTLATGLRRPCAVAILGDFAAVAEVESRVVITDKAGRIVATLGDNPDRKQWAEFKVAPEFWRDGILIAPHGLAFDSAGNLFVQDWNFTGRLTKLSRGALSSLGI